MNEEHELALKWAKMLKQHGTLYTLAQIPVNEVETIFDDCMSLLEEWWLYPMIRVWVKGLAEDIIDFYFTQSAEVAS